MVGEKMGKNCFFHFFDLKSSSNGFFLLKVVDKKVWQYTLTIARQWWRWYYLQRGKNWPKIPQKMTFLTKKKHSEGKPHFLEATLIKVFRTKSQRTVGVGIWCRQMV